MADTGFISLNANSPTNATGTTMVAPPAAAKRKRDSQLKFYAVRVGKAPGIYHTWAECLDQVKGFPKAQFKSFTSLTDANHYVDGDADASGKGGGAGSTQKWYGVRSGRVPGVYTSWQEVLDQITGWKGPKHRGFKTRIEAEMFVAEGRRAHQGLPNGYTVAADGPVESIEPADAPAQKKTKMSKSKKGNGIKDEMASPDLLGGGEYEPGEAPLPDDAEDNFDTSIILDQSTGLLRYKTALERIQTKYQASAPTPAAPIRIYTDGSSLANGQAGAIGGVGVYFGPNDRRNISEALPGTKQTNQRAELTAILRALEVAPRDRQMVIYSDSNYAIRCSSEWFQNWRRNNWVNSSKKPVENKDLILKIVDVLEDRYKMNAHRVWDDDNGVDDTIAGERGYWERGAAGVKFVWVKGHAKNEGNNAADCLATAAAREAKELTNDVLLD